MLRKLHIGEVPKVPMDVGATGPKVIGIGARLAERGITVLVNGNATRVAD